MSSAARATETPITVPSAKGVAKKLFAVVPRHRNREIELKFGEREKRVLHELIEYYGVAWAADQIGLSPLTVYRLLAGFSESCRPTTKQQIAKFFVGYYK